jgi:hypothetical protein
MMLAVSSSLDIHVDKIRPKGKLSYHRSAIHQQRAIKAHPSLIHASPDTGILMLKLAQVRRNTYTL